MRCWILGTLALLAVMPGLRADDLRPAEPYRLEARDWPCEQPYQADLPLGLYWSHPELLKGASDWRGDAELKRLVETVTAFDSSMTRSVETIDAFSAALPADPAARNARLATLYRGLLDETNFYREIIVQAVLQFVAKQKLAADLVAEAELAFQDAGVTDDKARADLEQRHWWASRALDDARGEARFQCHRLGAVEARFARMSAAVEKGIRG